MRRVACILLLLVFCEAVFGQSTSKRHSRFSWPKIKGRVDSTAYYPTSDSTDDPSEFRQVSLGAWLGADPKFTKNFLGHFMFSGDHLFSSTVTTTDGMSHVDESIFKIREANLQYRTDSWDFRAGQQSIPWGVSDGINPTDFLSATDQRVLSPWSEDKRISHPSALITFTPNEGTSNLGITGVATAIFPRSNLLLSKDSLPSTVKLTIADEHTVLGTRGGAEGALRISYLGDGWDADIIGFLGYDHVPFYREDSRVVSATGIHETISPEYDEVGGFGTNLSFTAGAWIFRSEIAYENPEQLPELMPINDAQHIDGVLGVERGLGSDFRAQLQGLIRDFPYFETLHAVDPVQEEIRKANGLIHAMNQQVRTGASLRLSFEDKDLTSFTAEISGITYFGDEFEYLVRPMVSYAWVSGPKISVGLEYADGPASTPLGALKGFNSSFADARWEF